MVPSALCMTVHVVQGVAVASAIVRDSSITQPDLNITKTNAQIPKNHSVVDMPAKSKGDIFQDISAVSTRERYTYKLRERERERERESGPG